jgi:DNA (cytosine-5)-methyltransferase 1
VNVGSLFAGIGGFDLGLERAGFRVDWQVELDPYCRAVLARRFQRACRFADVREVGSGTLPPVDLVCGGFPCQDLSVAGRGAGLSGARSGLWSEFARIVRELRPGYVIVENVPALLSGKGKRWDRAPIGRVLGDLAALRYDAEWACLSAREFGAPHLRKRVWIVAYPSRDASAGPAAPAGSERERARPGGAAGGATGMADADGERCEALPRIGAGWSAGTGDPLGVGPRGRGGRGPSHPWAVEPDVGRVAHGVPDRVDRLAALGNALVPQIAEWLGRRILEYEGEAMTARPPAMPAEVGPDV